VEVFYSGSTQKWNLVRHTLFLLTGSLKAGIKLRKPKKISTNIEVHFLMGHVNNAVFSSILRRVEKFL